MGTRDSWIFLIIFAGFSAVLFLVTVLIAQLETYVPSRKVRALARQSVDDFHRHTQDSHRHTHDQDEPTAA